MTEIHLTADERLSLTELCVLLHERCDETFGTSYYETARRQYHAAVRLRNHHCRPESPAKPPVMDGKVGLRDQFAMAALPALLAEIYAGRRNKEIDPNDVYVWASLGAYKVADEMMKARKDSSKPTFEVSKLDWSEPSEPDETCGYDHVVANSPVGKYSIEWKSWKDYDDYTVFLAGSEEGCVGNGGWGANALENAKSIAQADFERRIRSALVGTAE